MKRRMAARLVMAGTLSASCRSMSRLEISALPLWTDPTFWTAICMLSFWVVSELIDEAIVIAVRVRRLSGLRCLFVLVVGETKVCGG